MTRSAHLFWAALIAIAGLLATGQDPLAAPFSQRKIIIEVNATDGDGGIQIFVDAAGWGRLEVSDPNGQKVFDVQGSGSVGQTGVTELFFESAEPSFEDLPLDQLLARFTAGDYTFRGTTVDGKPLSGKAALRHNIPAGPSVTLPEEDSALDPGAPVVIDWDPVTEPFEGTVLPVTITGYQVIVERVKPQPLLAFSVFLPAATTSVTVPAEFIEGNADYKFEVLAIEASGNQTITESTFSTSVTKLGAAGEPMLRRRAEAGARATADGHGIRLSYQALRSGSGRLRVFDVAGRLVKSVSIPAATAGWNEARFDDRDDSGRTIRSGVYFYRLEVGGEAIEGKLVVAR